MRVSLNDAVRCVRDVLGVRRGALTGAPTREARIGTDATGVLTAWDTGVDAGH